MSRTSAAIGGGLGAVAGSIAGYYVNRNIRATSDMPFAELVGAVTGAIVGAAVGAGDPPILPPGTPSEYTPSRFP